MSPAARRPRHASLPTLVATSFLSAIFLFAVLSVSAPGDVLGATHPKVTLCSTNLRTSSTTNSTVRKVIRAGLTVSAVTRVTGRSWSTSCAGKNVSGRTWFRISAVNGKSVRSLYGVRYLYAATGLFAPAPLTRYAACNVNLRTGPAKTAAVTTVAEIDTKVIVATKVTGTSWSTTCAGKAVSGSDWYRISTVNGNTVHALYGVRYVYAAQGLFKGTGSVAVEPEAVPTPTPTPPAFANMTEGIDISHWQGAIDWSRVAAAGKKFAFMKASESTTYVDPTYTWNRQQAKANGLYVGAYHFAQPSTGAGDAIAEADHFMDTATPASGDLIPVLDLERSNSLSQSALTAWVRAFLDRVYERIGVRAAIYVSPNFWKNYMGDTTWFAANGYDILWVAHWTAATTPLVPAANWGGEGWTFWQYTSSGSVAGISGRVDLDRYRGKDFTEVRIP